MTEPFKLLNEITAHLIAEREDNGNGPEGTYVAVKPSKEAIEAISNASREMGAPNKIRRDKMHITLIYSRKHLPDFEPRGKLETPIIATPTALEIFPTQDGSEQVLVIRFDAPELVKRHEEIMKEHGATYDFDEYKPHLTLSYDCEDFDVDSVDLSELLGPIEMVEEYSEDLKT